MANPMPTCGSIKRNYKPNLFTVYAYSSHHNLEASALLAFEEFDLFEANLLALFLLKSDTYSIAKLFFSQSVLLETFDGY